MRWSEPASIPIFQLHDFLPTLMQTRSIGQAMLVFGLLHMGCVGTVSLNLYTGRLFGCNCLLKNKAVRWCACIHSHILTAWISSNMDCIVTVWIAVGCFVVSACLKYSSEMVWTSIITRIPPAWLSSNLLQPNGIGQTSVYVWVGPHGLHCDNLIQFAYWQVVWL